MGFESGTWVFFAVAGVLVVFAAGLGFYAMLEYNSLVGADTAVEQKWANVQTSYQRRADLIPNLVETVKGASDFEHKTQTEIAALRSQATQTRITVQNAKDAVELQSAGDGMNAMMSRIRMISENYPDLKSNQNFMSLQAELATTENQIKSDRDAYNFAVRDYKTSVRSFPQVLFAGSLGFGPEKWKMFIAEDVAQKAPLVEFQP